MEPSHTYSKTEVPNLFPTADWLQCVWCTHRGAEFTHTHCTWGVLVCMCTVHLWGAEHACAHAHDSARAGARGVKRSVSTAQSWIGRGLLLGCMPEQDSDS